MIISSINIFAHVYIALNYVDFCGITNLFERMYEPKENMSNLVI